MLHPCGKKVEDIALLEQYFVVMYSATWNTTDVNICWRILFTNGASAEIDKIFCEPFYKQRNDIDVFETTNRTRSI